MFDANYEGRVNTCGNILFQPKPHYPWSHLKKSSVMQKFLVAPVARATPLSLLCICCVLHAQVHPQRSARVARFARSLAARQQSDFQTSYKSMRNQVTSQQKRGKRRARSASDAPNSSHSRFSMSRGSFVERSWEAFRKPRCVQDGVKTAQNGAKTAQDGARRPKMVLRRPQDSHRWLQDCLKTR